jgi:hypothetical protein
MKISKTRTSQILVKAVTGSEWDSCNCCLIDIEETIPEKWRHYDKVATEMSKAGTYEFAYLAMYEGGEYLNLYPDHADEDEDQYDIVEEIPEIGWCYVDTEDDDVDDLQRPEQRIDTHMMRFYGDGIVKWVAYGKHTSEEFWTDQVNINELT